MLSKENLLVPRATNSMLRHDDRVPANRQPNAQGTSEFRHDLRKFAPKLSNAVKPYECRLRFFFYFLRNAGVSGTNKPAASDEDAAGIAFSHENALKRRGRDSNPGDGLSRQQHFQCCAFSRSATSPSLQPVYFDEGPGSLHGLWPAEKVDQSQCPLVLACFPATSPTMSAAASVLSRAPARSLA